MTFQQPCGTSRSPGRSSMAIKPTFSPSTSHDQNLLILEFLLTKSNRLGMLLLLCRDNWCYKIPGCTVDYFMKIIVKPLKVRDRSTSTVTTGTPRPIKRSQILFCWIDVQFWVLKWFVRMLKKAWVNNIVSICGKVPVVVLWESLLGFSVSLNSAYRSIPGSISMHSFLNL